MDTKEEFRSLRTAYEAAFRELAAETQTLQFLMTRPDANGQALETAYARAEKARKAYRDRRDKLMGWLLQVPEQAPQTKHEPVHAHSDNAGRSNNSIDEAKAYRANRFVACCGH
jgi:hypothetical protein